VFKRLHFIHQPKCGGNGLYRALLEAWQVEPDQVPHYFPFDQRMDSVYFRRGFHCYAEAERGIFDTLHTTLSLYFSAGYPVIGDHHPFSPRLFEAFRHNTAFITVLRDPLARVRSHLLYNVFLNRGARPDHNRPKDAPFDVIAELEKSLGTDALEHISNIYLKNLGGLTPTDTVDFSPVEALGRAFAAIDLLDVVGMLDDMDRFASELQEVTGRQITLPNANQTRDFADSPAQYEAAQAWVRRPELEATLRDLCRYDAIIYQYARYRLGLTDAPPPEALEGVTAFQAFFEHQPDVRISGRKASGWMGEIVLATFPWCYHQELGWLKLLGKASPDEFWVERKTIGEACLRRDAYPRLYAKQSDSWFLASAPGTCNQGIWDYANEAWIS